MAEEDEFTPQAQHGGLGRRDYEDVMIALRDWADSHPKAKEPIFFEMGRSYSPVQFVIEVGEHTDIGISFLRYVAFQSQRTDTRPRTFIDRAIRANVGE
jgi:hypothetical protein